jgi:inner membrane protein involved in colicin E2 resistance
MTQLNKEQEKTLFLLVFNVLTGIAIAVYLQSINDCLTYGLWHKIIPFAGINIPIGIISMAFMTFLTGAYILVCVKNDYLFITKGINEVFKKTSKKEVLSQ